MAHISPLTDHDIADTEILASFAHYEKTRGFVPNSIRTMARRPAIAKAFMALNQAVLYEGTVAIETKMLVSLASSMAAGCQYCESHMTNLSSIYEASDEKIAAIWEFESSDLFSDAERAAITIGLNAGGSPNEATAEDFTELKKHYSDEEIVEIMASAALFGYLNRWNDTMATTLEVLAADVAERVIGSVGWTPGKHA
ncbi:carboxymuconolactone decarboxylase family protein [Cryobacterium sp. PH29-G1]|uniref:carboxymuconolactone decarboxylase family protein n=1 Tax=Cryobacterium sp. PH29-G1 TaxID=3046211 RepID=UPI0024BB91E4|nr:carboxymuconolactone decarboxylase family protein [Cryobacterium sp. PH29-G1]MDJ0349625.1 carboxymuconolactone decarboxylase family protein [Cryobacterium sp. PH29-G1]